MHKKIFFNAREILRLPELRIALNSGCNLRCRYCPPNGENFANIGRPLKINDLLRILEGFYQVGFRRFGFTGGEPLLNQNLPAILRYCRDFQMSRFKLYTNGVLIRDNIPALKHFDLIKLSLDTVDRKKFKLITGRDDLDKVIEGIDIAVAKKMKIRINTVLTKLNCDEIGGLIKFCCDRQIDLKVLDLNCFDKPGYRTWQNFYQSPEELVKFLEDSSLDKKTIYTAGNYGIPMLEFKYKKISIRVKDSRKSSTYPLICRKCKYFLCQEGLYHLALTNDGRIKMCKHRPDISFDLSKISNDVRIKNTIMNFTEANFFRSKRIFQEKQVFTGRFGRKTK